MTAPNRTKKEIKRIRALANYYERVNAPRNGSMVEFMLAISQANYKRDQSKAYEVDLIMCSHKIRVGHWLQAVKDYERGMRIGVRYGPRDGWKPKRGSR